ncbi:hypothetical protein [Streptomyces sp. NPDC087270]|uniref:hypothetical protein n=1 Tax=Streptomyces sp. NPDC087270 TaxID=3365774 RepID=UPI00380C605E
MTGDGVVRMRGYLRRRAWGLGVLAGWSVVESVQTFVVGYAVAKALDDGFLRGRDAAGLWWLALAAVATPSDDPGGSMAAVVVGGEGEL